MKIAYQLGHSRRMPIDLQVFSDWRLRRIAFTAEAQRRRGTRSLIYVFHLCGPLRLSASAVNDPSEAALLNPLFPVKFFQRIL